MKKKGLPPFWKQPIVSVIVWQQDRRGSVALCDDVESPASLRVIHGEQPESVAQAALVFLPVVLVEVAPIAAVMPAECGLHFVVWDGGECSGCGDDVAKLELFRRGLFRAGFVSG